MGFSTFRINSKLPLNVLEKKFYGKLGLRYEIETNPEYSNLKKHLQKYRDYITSSNFPYGIHRPRKSFYFDSPKILFKGMFCKPEFCYDDEQLYVGMSFSVIISKSSDTDLKYILAILNSKLAMYWFSKMGKQRGIGVDISISKLYKFPIVKKFQYQKVISKIVSTIIQDKKLGHSSQYNIDLVDLLVFKLYDLTYLEVKLVDPHIDLVLAQLSLSSSDFERLTLEDLTNQYM